MTKTELERQIMFINARIYTPDGSIEDGKMLIGRKGIIEAVGKKRKCPYQQGFMKLTSRGS